MGTWLLSHVVKAFLTATEKAKTFSSVAMHRELLYEKTSFSSSFYFIFIWSYFIFFPHPLKISVNFQWSWSSEVMVYAVFRWCGATRFLLISYFFFFFTRNSLLLLSQYFSQWKRKGKGGPEVQESAMRSAGYPLRCITPVFVITAVLHMMPSLTETWPLRSSADHFRTKLMPRELTGSWSSWSVWIIKM